MNEWTSDSRAGIQLAHICAKFYGRVLAIIELFEQSRIEGTDALEQIRLIIRETKAEEEKLK